MNSLQKDHKLVGQNESMIKSTKHDANLRKNSTIYFQVGLILTLLAVHGLLEMRFHIKPIVIEEPIHLSDPDVYVNFVPEPQQQPIKEPEVTPQRKPLLALKFKQIKNSTPLNKAVKKVVVETPSTNIAVTPVINKPKEDNKEAYGINKVEQVPIYPGCEKFESNDERKNCMSKKIGRLISRRFNTGLGEQLGLTGKQRISVQFKIDADGNVTEIMARAPHDRLEKEAVKVVGKIPQMIPGKQRDKNVSVIYSLPIIFQVQQ